MIVRNVNRLDGSLRGKFARQELVQSIGLPCEGNVVSNVGSLASQLVWLHDEAAYVPGQDLNGEVTDHCWSHGYE